MIINRSVRFSRPLPRAPPPPSLLVSNRFNLLDHRFVLLDKNISVINDEPTVFTTPLDIWTLRESRKKGELRPHAGTGFKSHDVLLSRPNQKDILMNFNLSFFRGRGATLVRSKSSSPNRQVEKSHVLNAGCIFLTIFKCFLPTYFIAFVNSLSMSLLLHLRVCSSNNSTFFLTVQLRLRIQVRY